MKKKYLKCTPLLFLSFRERKLFRSGCLVAPPACCCCCGWPTHSHTHTWVSNRKGGLNISSWLRLDGPTYLSRMLTPDSRAASTTWHDTWFGGLAGLRLFGMGLVLRLRMGMGMGTGLVDGDGEWQMEAVANPLGHAHLDTLEGGGLHSISLHFHYEIPFSPPKASYFLTCNSIGFPMSTSTFAS